MFVSQIIDEVLEILGTTDRPRALRKLTQAVQALMQSGHHYHLISEVDICTGWDGMTVTLPRGIEVPLAVNVDGSPVYFRGRLFQYSVNKGGMYNPVQWAWDDRGMVATQMDIRQPSQLIAVAENEGDAGKFIRVIGTDANNRDLRAQLDDGTGVDGVLIRIRALSEFPYGTIQPDGVTISTRTAAVEPVYVFTSEIGVFPMQGFQSGQSVVFESHDGSFPPGGLTLKQSYYTHKIDSVRFSLHKNQLDSISGIYPVLLLNEFSVLSRFSDIRSILPYSGVSISSTPLIEVENGSEVTFTRTAPSTPLPSPLVEDTVYFVRQIKASNVSDFCFELYNTNTDAINGQNIISLIGSPVNQTVAKMFIRQKMTAQTKLLFSTNTGYSSGDVVQANTAGGTLPQPLLVAQNYYVHVLDGDPSPISLHLTYADSITGENPINLTTAGSGNNSVAKLLQSTTATGTRNNITTNGLSLPAPQGQGAIITALPSGPVTGAAFITAGSGYSSATASVSDLGGYNYAATPTITLLGGTFTTAAQLVANMLTTPVAGGGTMQYVGSVTVVNAGSGYSSTNLPRVVFSGPLAPGGVHARASLNINSSGNVTGVSFIPYGSGATVSISVNTTSGIPNAIIINQSGSGYVYPPRLTIQAPIAATNTSLTSATLNAGTTDMLFQTTLTSSQVYFPAGASIKISATGNPSAYMLGTVVSFEGTGLIFNPMISSGSGTYNSWDITLTSSTGQQSTGVLLISTSFISDYIVENGGSGYNNAPAITISQEGEGSGAQVSAVIDRFGIGRINVVNGGSGYNANSTATIRDSNGGTGYGATATVQVSGGVIQTVTVTSNGAGYSAPVITISPAGGIGAQFSFEYTSVVAGVDVVATGTGYTTAPLVSVNPSTGVFVQFSSTGTMPAPLTQGTSYRAEYPATGNSFTVKNADFSDINITSSGSGTFYTVLSYSFSIGFTNIWNGNFSSITTNEVRVQSQYELPATTPPISLTQPFWLKKITNTSAELYSDAGATSLVKVNGFGVGQTYFALPYNAAARNFNNEFNISKIDYLVTGDKVQFTSSGTLPAPLSPDTFYSIEISGERFVIKGLVLGTPVVLTNLGNSSNISLVKSTRASAENPTSVIVENCMFQTGDKVAAREGSDDTLPYPLSSSTPYFVRRAGANAVKLFLTREEALIDGNAVAITEIGDTTDSTFYLDSIKDPTLVKLVAHVEKPLTSGYVSLYAFDYGRSNDMALIGQYHPSETNPKYRRVRIGKPCAWVRMIYRVRAPEFTSEYDYIPIENPRAIIAAVHAVDLEDKDFLDQAQKYWQVASAYLRNENESMDGHAMQTPQINNLTFGDGSDPVMF
jgi:hypothetical protein